MKHLFPQLLVATILLSSTAISQNKKYCSSLSDTEILDLNSISKCTIEKSNDDSKKTSLNVAAKKTRKRIVRKREKVNSINHITSELNRNVTKTNLEIKNELLTKKIISEVVLFNVVENIPLFPKCKNDNNKSIDCFNNEFSKHFANTFDPERASYNEVSCKVFIQFTIDIQGNTTDILIKARKKDKLLETEIRRVINKLPKLYPGNHKGLPVAVKYSLPINFNIE